MPWNKYAQTYPLVVFFSCTFLFRLQMSRQNWMHLVPITVLGINSGLAFIFWTIRLKARGERSDYHCLLRIHKPRSWWCRAPGFAGSTGCFLIAPHWLARSSDGLSVGFWMMWGFALTELVHNHLYKLTFGRNTLERIIVGHRWNEISKPLGGAIGQQIRKSSEIVTLPQILYMIA